MDFVFSRQQQKMYCSCCHWDVSCFAHRGFFFFFLFSFSFFLFFFFVYFALKKVEGLAGKLEKLLVEMEGPEKQRLNKHDWNGDKKGATLLSLLKGWSWLCMGEVADRGGEHQEREKEKAQSWEQEFPSGGKRERNCARGQSGQRPAEEIRGQADELVREKGLTSNQLQFQRWRRGSLALGDHR